MPQCIGNFTFKKVILTGRYRSFEAESHDIKLKRRLVGHIKLAPDAGQFKIMLAVKKERTEESPCNFKWITFKARFNSAEEARQWLKARNSILQEKYDLYLFEKD
jgi:hypothetical protein